MWNKNETDRQQTKYACLLSLKGNCVQRKVKLSDLGSSENFDGFGYVYLLLKPEKSGHTLLFGCPGLCKMEKMNGKKKKREKQRRREHHDDRGLSTAFQEAPDMLQ